MAQHRYIGTEDRELVDARGRRVVVTPATSPTSPTTPPRSPSCGNPHQPHRAGHHHSSKKKGDN